MTQPKRRLHSRAGELANPAYDEQRSREDRSPTVIAFALVAVVSMLFGFVIGLFF